MKINHVLLALLIAVAVVLVFQASAYFLDCWDSSSDIGRVWPGRMPQTEALNLDSPKVGFSALGDF